MPSFCSGSLCLKVMRVTAGHSSVARRSHAACPRLSPTLSPEGSFGAKVFRAMSPPTRGLQVPPEQGVWAQGICLSFKMWPDPTSFLGSLPWPLDVCHPTVGHWRASLLRALLGLLAVARGLLRPQAPTPSSSFLFILNRSPHPTNLSRPGRNSALSSLKVPGSKAPSPKSGGHGPTASAPTQPRAAARSLCPFLAGCSQDHEGRLLPGPPRAEDGRPAHFPQPPSDHSILLAPGTEGPCLGSSPSERHPQP